MNANKNSFPRRKLKAWAKGITWTWLIYVLLILPVLAWHLPPVANDLLYWGDLDRVKGMVYLSLALIGAGGGLLVIALWLTYAEFRSNSANHEQEVA